MIDLADQILEFALWTFVVTAYLFCAFSVALVMTIDKKPPAIIISGRDPKKPVSINGAILHGLFWPAVFIIKILSRKEK